MAPSFCPPGRIGPPSSSHHAVSPSKHCDAASAASSPPHGAKVPHCELSPRAAPSRRRARAPPLLCNADPASSGQTPACRHLQACLLPPRRCLPPPKAYLSARPTLTVDRASAHPQRAALAKFLCNAVETTGGKDLLGRAQQRAWQVRGRGRARAARGGMTDRGCWRRRVAAPGGRRAKSSGLRRNEAAARIRQPGRPACGRRAKEGTKSRRAAAKAMGV